MTKEEMIELVEQLELSEDIKDPAGLLQALKNANAEAKEKREALETAEAEIERLSGFKSGAKGTALERELKAVGVKNPERITRLMNVDSIEMGDDGKLTGFEEQLELVKTDFPELFDSKLKAQPIEQFEQKPIERQMTATEIQLAAVKANRK